jgi:hypothetical protein
MVELEFQNAEHMIDLRPDGAMLALSNIRVPAETPLIRAPPALHALGEGYDVYPNEPRGG